MTAWTHQRRSNGLPVRAVPLDDGTYLVRHSWSCDRVDTMPADKFAAEFTPYATERPAKSPESDAEPPTATGTPRNNTRPRRPL